MTQGIRSSQTVLLGEDREAGVRQANRIILEPKDPSLPSTGNAEHTSWRNHSLSRAKAQAMASDMPALQGQSP